MDTYSVSAMTKRRSLTPRLAELLNPSPLFKKGDSSANKPSAQSRPMTTVPIAFPEDPNLMDTDSLMGTTIKGQMRLDEETREIVIEFAKENPMSLTGKSNRFEAITVKLMEIDHIEFKRMTWLYWSNQIRIQFKSLTTLGKFPRHFDGELRLSVPYGKRELADDLVSAIKLARADQQLEDAERDANKSD